MKLKEFLIKLRGECREKLTNNGIEIFDIKKKIEIEERLIKPEKLFPKFINSETRRGLLLVLSIFSFLATIGFLVTAIPFGLLSLFFTGLIIYTTITDYLKTPDSNFAKEYDLSELYKRLDELEKENDHLKALVDDISLCQDYHNYVLSEKLKEVSISFDTKTAMSQGCLLSTLLHVYYYYHSHFEEFLRLDKESQKNSENYLDLRPKIIGVKKEKYEYNFSGGSVGRTPTIKKEGYLLDATLNHVGRRR